MRVILGCILTLVLTSGLSADDKIDVQKLVGRWEVEWKGGVGYFFEFAKDGKSAVTYLDGKGDARRKMGTYTIDGNKLVLTRKTDDADRIWSFTVSKLTETELKMADKSGKENTLVRIKDIDPKKLVGRWELKAKTDKGPTFVFDFATNGKFVILRTDDGKERRIEGTYKLDGGRLAMTNKVDDQELISTETVLKLTDTEMVMVNNEAGGAMLLGRIKNR